MSDLPLFPVYLGGVWPAASWHIRQVLESKRHPDRIYPEDGDETDRDAHLVALDDQLRVGADIVSTSLGVPGVAEGSALLERIQGLELLPTRRHLASRLHSNQPLLQQTKPLLALRGLGVATDTERMLSLVQTATVASMPGPYTLAGLIMGGSGRIGTAITLASILRSEMESLAATGVSMVQIDECGFSWAPEDPSVLADLIRRTVDGIPVEVCLRLGYLDRQGRPMGRRSYAPWLVDTATAVTTATINVRQIDLAFAGMEMSELEILGQLPARRIGLGVVDAACSWIEPSALILERLKLASQFIPAERIWVAADAGLGALTRGVAVRKVHSMVEAARQMREMYGVREAPPTSITANDTVVESDPASTVRTESNDATSVSSATTSENGEISG